MRTTKWIGRLGALATAALLATCATTGPPAELEQARSEYVRVARSPAVDLAPTEMEQARDALQKAERAFEEHGAGEEARSLAYVALRRVQLAEARAQQALADRRSEAVQVSQDALRQEFRADMARELAEPSETEEAPDWEARRHRIQAEAGAPYAVALLQEYARVHRDDDGYVLSLTAGDLFDEDDAEVRARGTEALEGVARFLAEMPEADVEVVGHTHRLGLADHNQRLSERRADAVRTWLVVHGIPGDRITAAGRGEMEPIDSNDTEAGRRANERIDILVWPTGRR